MASTQRKPFRTPLQVTRLSREIKSTLNALVPEYREAHTYVRGRKDGRHLTDDERKQQSQIGAVKRFVDPTGDIVAGQETNRERLIEAGEKLARAKRDIKSAEALIKHVFSSPDDYYQQLESYRS